MFDVRHTHTHIHTDIHTLSQTHTHTTHQHLDTYRHTHPLTDTHTHHTSAPRHVQTYTPSHRHTHTTRQHLDTYTHTIMLLRAGADKDVDEDGTSKFYWRRKLSANDIRSRFVFLQASTELNMWSRWVVVMAAHDYFFTQSIP